MTESQALERADAAPVAVPIPSVLRELGVRIAEDAATGNRLVLIPSDVRQRVNVIDPVTSLVQADPNWTPRVNVVELNPDPDNGPHYYKQAGGKLAPTKQALEVLAKAAGILSTTTERMPRAELDEGEIGYRATVTIRRSDGTTEHVQREKVWVKEAERSEIEEAVRTARNKRWQHTDEQEIEKRWLKELKDRYAKTESKAVLRAIRAALQMPHTFSPQDAAKPFLIIGFNFTPDYNDVEIRRMLVAAGMNASTALYGPRALEPPDTVDVETGEITAASETGRPDESEPQKQLAAGGGSEHDPQPVSGASASPLFADAAPAPGNDDDEPEPGGPHVGPQADAEVEAAGDVAAPPDLKLAGTNVRDITDEEWILWALSHRRRWKPEQLAFATAVRLWTEHRNPELWARAQAANSVDAQS